MTDRKLSLIDMSEEEQESLVHSSSQDAPSSTLMGSTQPIPENNNTAATMTPTSEEDWEDLNAKKDEHPLASLSLEEYETSDPWSTQPENNALLTNVGQEEVEQEEKEVLQPVVVPTSAVIDQPASFTKETQQKRPEVLDTDTSAIKGFQNFEDSDKIDDLNVTGHLPEWLTGEHFTVGPATYDIKYMRKVEIDGDLVNATAIFTFGHWFDALPLVNRFDLNGQRNTVTYRNRSTSRRLVEKIREHHGYAPQHPAALYMSNTNQTVLSKILGSSKAAKPDAEPCSARVLANIPGFEGRLFAQNFANHIQELDPFDLKPTRLMTWNEINPKFRGTSSCPNGQYDERTGEYINFVMDVGYQSVKYNFFSISDKQPKGDLIASVTAPMAYVNTFSITPRYIIFVVCPILANSGGVKYNWNESLMDSFSFQSSEPTLFYVISREKGDVVATYRSDPCFVFNHINAYEDERGNVLLDMICYPDDTIARQLTTEFLRHPTTMKPSRLVASEVRRYMLANVEEEGLTSMTKNTAIPSKNGVTTKFFGLFGSNRKQAPATTDTVYNPGSTNKWYSSLPVATFDKRVQPSIELPQINPRFNMYKHTIMYGLGFSASSSLKDGAIWDSIVKTNMDTKQIVASWHQDHCYPSEAVFVPRPSIGPEDELSEDEGVLLSVVMDSARATSFLLVLDASSLKLLATADLERLVPLSFSHGTCRLRDN